MCALIKNLKIQDSPNPVWYIKGQSNNYYNDVVKTFMGRDAINILLNNIRKKSVLLPAYTCNEVISEFEKYNYKIHFYDIKKDFTIDLDKIKDQISNEKIDVFYNIVYFGFKSLTRHIAKKLKEQFPELFIIEDRAHYLSNVHNFEECNAYIYSFRKLLPISEGGGLATKHKINFNYKGKVLANILPFLMFVKKISLGHVKSLSRSSLVKEGPKDYVKPISFLSNEVINKYNYLEEIELRRNLFKNWLEKLSLVGIKPVLSELKEIDIPLGCPIFIENAHAIQETMEHWGYYLKIHWPLNNSFKEIAPVSYAISNRLITLPIYNTINGADQDKIIKLLINAVSKNNM